MTNVVHIGVFAPQGCELISYASVIAPFIQANELLGQRKYEIDLIGSVIHIVDGHVEIGADNVIDDTILARLRGCELLIIIAENPPIEAIPRATKKVLQQYYQQQLGQIITVQSGLWWLLDSGINIPNNMVVHWAFMDDFKDSFPDVVLHDLLYHTGHRISSCAGKLAILEHILNYLKEREEGGLVKEIRDHLCMDRERAGNERQCLPSQAIGREDLHPRLTMAIDLMNNNIEEPLTTEEISNLVSVSRRQLERLFKSKLNTMPARHYLNIRLNRAKRLLQTSSKSIVQIGLSCGFSSGPHFSSAYKACYQITPREERTKFMGIR